MKALILAAGRGARLRPLTESLAKPLAPVVGRPAVVHLIDRLAKVGVEEVTLNLHWQARQIRSCLGKSQRGLPLNYVEEEQLTGTGGPLLTCAADLDSDPFLVASGDGVHDIDISALVDFHKQSGSQATMVCVRVRDVSEYGSVEIEGGKITAIEEKRPERKPGMVNAGVYVVSHAARALIDTVPASMVDDLLIPLLEKESLAAYRHQGFWSDIGSPEELVRTNLAAAQGRVDLRQALRGPGLYPKGVVVYEGSRIGKGVEWSGPAVVGPGARVTGNGQIGQCVILPGASVDVEASGGKLLGDPARIEDAYQRPLSSSASLAH